MRSQRADRHLAALQIARECVELGGYYRTVCHITGLNRSLVRQLFFQGQLVFGPRAPVSTEWLFRRNLTAHVHVSLIVSIFSDLVDSGFSHPKALTGAFHLYRRRMAFLGDRENTLDLNRAFVFVRHSFGLWGAPQTLHLVTCPDSRHRYVDAHAQPNCSTLRCPLCTLRRRAHLDVRVRSHLARLTGPTSIQSSGSPGGALHEDSAVVPVVVR